MSTITQAHNATHGGLRGHSIDETTYPWRIVGGQRTMEDGTVLATWSVVGVTGQKEVTVTAIDTTFDADLKACRHAKRIAVKLKAQHPSGRLSAKMEFMKEALEVAGEMEAPFFDPLIEALYDAIASGRLTVEGGSPQ